MNAAISEIRTARRALEAQLLREISAAVSNFQEATGVGVRNVVVATSSFTPIGESREATRVQSVTVDLERL